MAAFIRHKPPAWFWIVAVLLALWGVAGVIAFYGDATMAESTIAAMSEYDRAFFRSRPGWFIWVYGAATWFGLLGSLMLLARQRIAVAAYAVSLVAVVVQFGWVFLATDLLDAKPAAETVPFPVVIALVAVFQLWLARLARARGWIG